MLPRLRAKPVECRLDSLSDDILIHILSLIPFKDASKTSLLARRWRFLSFYLLYLDFEPAAFIPCFDQRGPKGLEAFRKTSAYVDWVDRVVCGVSSRQPSNIRLRRFRIRYFLDVSLSQKFESWLKFSLDRGVETLELDGCFYEDDNYSDYNKDMVPLCRFPSSIIQQPELFPKLRLLKSLSLSSIAIDTASLTLLLLSCELLESLRLCRIRYLKKVNITGDVSRLKYIDLTGCYFMRSITISAPTPNLLSLRYCYAKVKHIEHAPLLEDLFINHSINISFLVNHPLWRFTNQLKSLYLNIRASFWDRFPDLKLTGLKHLKIGEHCLYIPRRSDHSLWRSDLHGLATLIKAAPNIECLTLVVTYGIEELKIKKELDDLDLKFLRVIEYVGFCGPKDCELVMHMTNVFSHVEKLIIDCRPESIRMACSSYCTSAKHMKEWKRSASELKKGIRAGVKLKFLD